MAKKSEEKDKNNSFCFIGKLIGDNCSDQSSRGKNLPTCTFAECTEDVQPYFQPMFSGLESAEIAACPNTNERWLIRNRLQVDIDDSALLCGKHRSKYGIGFKASSLCAYPKHENTKYKVKSKKRQEMRIISAKNLSEIADLYSSLVSEVILPVGSMWCSACRLRLHVEALKEKNIETTLCLVCGMTHMDETPKKRRCVSLSEEVPHSSTWTPCSASTVESQEEFTPEEDSRRSFNESMGKIAENWTPVKYQLRTPYNDLAKKTKEKLLRKAAQAVDTVLENIAPGQGEMLKKDLFEQHIEINAVMELKDAVASAVGNVKVQLLSIIAGKKDGKYTYTINQLKEMFPGTSKHYIERARKHAEAGKIGMPLEPGQYHRQRLKDYQIDHFLDFIQHGGFVQDVASGTRRVTLSSGRKAVMPNVVKTVHNAEIIRLYEGACDKEGYVKERPSTRTLWNILNKCPASQRKSLAGLDNVAAEGSDAFDVIVKNLKTILAKNPDKKEEINNLIMALNKDKRYLKGEYKSNCSALESPIADHCRKYALSDPKIKEYQATCEHQHDMKCDDCEELKTTLSKVRSIDFTSCSVKEKGIMGYEISESCKKIETWKAHILTVIHQDTHKRDILDNLDHETCFIIIDFAMKFLSKRYRESMSNWFGKSGNGMHVMCVIFKNNNQLVKRTYIVFIGKASQDVGSVIAIFQVCLQQIKRDSPQIKFLIDKSDNAGCYHTEILFSWKAQWPQKYTGHIFLDTMFNERQAGKDQCDRDSATAKRQMNYYVNKGNNIENAVEMNEALRTATGLCGFNSSVMEIEKGECQSSDNIKNIAKIHHVKYTVKNGKKMYNVWQYYGIGQGKLFDVGRLPSASEYRVTVPFDNDHLQVGQAVGKQKKKKEVPIMCSDPLCSKSFDSVDEMLYHVDFEEHEYDVRRNIASQLAKVSDKWVKRFAVGESASSELVVAEQILERNQRTDLEIGWAIPQRTTRRFTVTQKNFLNQLFDEGEKTKSKISAEQALAKMKETLQPVHFLPLTSIKSYFSRRAKNIREGKSVLGEVFEDNEAEPNTNRSGENNTVESDANEELDDNEYGVEEQVDEEETSREKLVKKILVNIDVPDLQKDEWIAVNMGACWYPAQFEKYDAENEEIKVNFLHRSSSDSKWFVWPQLQLNGVEDASWITEDTVFYRLSPPKEGRRQVLLFDEVEEVNKLFADIKKL